MKINNKYAQLEVLNRFSYLLDEYSVRHLVAQDEKFSQFVESLNETVEVQASRILSTR